MDRDAPRLLDAQAALDHHASAPLDFESARLEAALASLAARGSKKVAA